MVYDIDLTPFSIQQRKEIMKGFNTKPEIPFWEYADVGISAEAMSVLRERMIAKNREEDDND